MSGSSFPASDTILPAADAAAAEAMRAAGLAATALGTATDHMRRQADGEAKALARLFAAQRLVDEAQEALQRAILGTLRNPPAEAGPHAAARRRAMARIALEAAVILVLDLPDRWARATRHDGGTRQVEEVDVVTALRLVKPERIANALRPTAARALEISIPPDGAVWRADERDWFLDAMARDGLVPAARTTATTS